MYKVCMDIVSRRLDGDSMCIMEAHENLDEISLVTRTQDNIKFYVKEILPPNSKFDATLMIYDYNHNIVVRKFVGLVIGKHLGVLIYNNANYRF